MPGAIDLTNQKFSRLTAMYRVENDKNGQARWHCHCDCGGATVVTTSNLRHNLIRSCGCLSKEISSIINRRHGLSHIPEYRVWNQIKDRCYNEKRDCYKDYGARGITMSDEWKDDFEAFYRDMGPRPTNHHTVERDNNNSGYSKENCRWATKLEQGNNKRNNIFFFYNGVAKTLATWCKELNLDYGVVYMRIQRGSEFATIVTELTKK